MTGDEITHYVGDGCVPPHPPLTPAGGGTPAPPRQHRVVVCASLTQPEAIDSVRAKFRNAGCNVTAPIHDPSSTPEEHAATWREWIDRADEVVAIAKPDGTVGDAVAGEVEYAESLGKSVRWYGPDPENTPPAEPGDALREREPLWDDAWFCHVAAKALDAVADACASDNTAREWRRLADRFAAWPGDGYEDAPDHARLLLAAAPPEREHDSRCASLHPGEVYGDPCDCGTWRLIDAYEAGVRAARGDAPPEREAPDYVRGAQMTYALDLWMALGGDSLDFDGYVERNGLAETWSNLLSEVRGPQQCGVPINDGSGERCVLAPHDTDYPHYGPSDVGRTEPLPFSPPEREAPSLDEEALRRAVASMLSSVVVQPSASADGVRRAVVRALEAAGLQVRDDEGGQE